ncbi:piggyBac transposable element-derived protein 4 [Trichonephila clavata]|uniref:PiggyBac transposable element-derived protein 4 n=1 Tax=Trichonephila clavata TaxID=2740835 RepID=A0A8X6KHQ2_TRICU|nr:piggyBac transposable element-derived protein 4 [Trichonephila clavata]
MSAVVNSWIAYCELKHRKTPLLDFIVPLAEALMASGKINAQYQCRRGTGRLSKTSRSLLNVGDHLPLFLKLDIRITYSIRFELFPYNQQCLENNKLSVDLREKKKLLKVLLLWSQQKRLQIFCLFCQSGQLIKNMI